MKLENAVTLRRCPLKGVLISINLSTYLSIYLALVLTLSKR